MALICSAIFFAGLLVLLLSERQRLQAELIQGKTDLEAFKADLKVFCEVIMLQESYSSQPTAAASSSQPGATVFVSPVFTHQVSNRFGESKLEELCPHSTETVEESIRQPS
jgi:hypothetical protein